MIRQIALDPSVYCDPMSTNNDNWRPLEAFIEVLRDFEMISERMEIVIKEHDYPPCADVLFAVARAKEAADRAATLLRSYVKRPH